VAYTVVKSFERGLDTRRLMECIDAGALLDAKDCHITRGGELEKRAAFVPMATLPATTLGFYVTEGPIYHTFGESLTVPAGMPTNGMYHAIPHPDGNALVAIMSVEEFMGKIYVIGQYEGGHLLHWWGDSIDADGVETPPLMALIVEWPGDPAVVTPPTGPPTPTPTPPPVDPGAKPEVTLKMYQRPAGPWEMYEVQLVTPNTGSGFTVYPISEPFDGTNTIVVPEDPTGVNAAAMIAQAVNDYDTSFVPVDVIAQVSGNLVRFIANKASPQYNGWSVQVVAAGVYMLTPSMPIPPTTYANMSQRTLTGGKNPLVPPAGLRGVFNEAQPFAEGDPVPLALGTFALAFNKKMYTVNGNLLNFSMEENASRWDEGTAFGAGNLDHTAIARGHPVLVALADYGGDLAVFGTNHVFIWIVDPLPELYRKKQALHRTGTTSPHSVTSFGGSDVMYLEQSGIRSLRARDSIDQAFTADLGHLIDRSVREQVETLTAEEKYHNVWGDIEPRGSRLWMAMKDKIFVLSYYPGSQIAAWTYYDASAYPVDMMNSTSNNVYWRSGNSVLSYGGANGDTYDDTEALARLPFISGDKPATHKSWTGIDAAIYGTWQVRGSFDPTLPTAFDLLANVTKSTYAQQKIAINGFSPAVSLEFRSSFVGPARIGNAAIHYEPSTAD
jgi:hypothetical protein